MVVVRTDALELVRRVVFEFVLWQSSKLRGVCQGAGEIRKHFRRVDHHYLWFHKGKCRVQWGQGQDGDRDTRPPSSARKWFYSLGLGKSCSPTEQNFWNGRLYCGSTRKKNWRTRSNLRQGTSLRRRTFVTRGHHFTIPHCKPLLPEIPTSPGTRWYRRGPPSVFLSDVKIGHIKTVRSITARWWVGLFHLFHAPAAPRTENGKISHLRGVEDAKPPFKLVSVKPPVKRVVRIHAVEAVPEIRRGGVFSPAERRVWLVIFFSLIS